MTDKEFKEIHYKNTFVTRKQLKLKKKALKFIIGKLRVTDKGLQEI